jgi:hypothetical protein
MNLPQRVALDDMTTRATVGERNGLEDARTGGVEDVEVVEIPAEQEEGEQDEGEQEEDEGDQQDDEDGADDDVDWESDSLYEEVLDKSREPVVFDDRGYLFFP